MKNRCILVGLLCSVLAFNIFAQTPITVAESTFKVSPQSEEVFYYGFAEGDQLVFNFEEVNGKELKELEIIELPGSSKFLDYKSKKIENKILVINKTGIYKFRFANSNIISGRICRFKIQRIPSTPQTKDFNTSVFTRTVFDTTYTSSQERYLIKSDTIISELTNQTAKVHSQTNLNGSRTTFNFVLPENTISWSYYIGVDQAGQQAYEKATKDLMGSSSISKLSGYSPLAAVALGAVSYLPLLQRGEDIDFFIVQGNNVNLFMGNQQFAYIKKGKVINDFSKMDPVKGNLHVCLSNDNAVMPVSVLVKITAIQLNEIWETRPTKKMSVISKQEMYLKN